MSDHDPRGLYGHHPDCPMSRHGDSVLVRTAMHPCNFCEVADKAEQRGYERGRHDAAADIMAVPPVTTWTLDDGYGGMVGNEVVLGKPSTRINLVDQAKAVVAAQGLMSRW